MDLTQYKIKDIYSGSVLRVSTMDDLRDWLMEKTVTKTDEFLRQIKLLGAALDSGGEYKWHAVALGLEMEPKKKTRRRTK